MLVCHTSKVTHLAMLQVNTSVVLVSVIAIMKRKYTIDNPPRVYDVAMAIGLTSEQTKPYLYNYTGTRYLTPSHRVSLPIAIKFIQWLKHE